MTTHPDLDDVRLFLAAWGYNTEAAPAQHRHVAVTRLVRGGLVRAGRLWHRLSP